MTTDEAIAIYKQRYEQECAELWTAAETFVRSIGFPNPPSIVLNMDGGIDVLWWGDAANLLAAIGTDVHTYETERYATIVFKQGDEGFTEELELSKIDYPVLRQRCGFVEASNE